MTVFIRIGLAVLFLDELVVGAWNAISPETFYRSSPTVDLTSPFSEHYARDLGGATLGIALLLGIGIILVTTARDRRAAHGVARPRIVRRRESSGEVTGR